MRESAGISDPACKASNIGSVQFDFYSLWKITGWRGNALSPLFIYLFLVGLGSAGEVGRGWPPRRCLMSIYIVRVSCPGVRWGASRGTEMPAPTPLMTACILSPPCKAPSWGVPAGALLQHARGSGTACDSPPREAGRRSGTLDKTLPSLSGRFQCAAHPSEV